MSRRSSFVMACSALIAATALGAHARAGGIHDTIALRTTVEASLGIRVLMPTGLRGGPTKFDAQVVDAERFAGRGFPNAKVNDKVTIHVLGNDRGRVVHERSSKAHNFRIKDDGKVEKDD